MSVKVRQKTGGCWNQSQTDWNVAKPWNEQFLHPSLAKVPYPPPLYNGAFFSPLFFSNCFISQSVLLTLQFSFLSFFFKILLLSVHHILCVNQYLVRNTSVLMIKILIISCPYRGMVAPSLSLPPPSLLIISWERGKPFVCKAIEMFLTLNCSSRIN